MSKKFLTIALAVVAIVLIIFAVNVSDKSAGTSTGESAATTTETNIKTASAPAKNQTTSPVVQKPSGSTGTTPHPAGNYSVLVTYTNSGFSPATVEITAGQTVRFVNQSNLAMWVASDPYPTNDNLPGFNENTAVGKGGHYDYLFNTVGSWGYHNHVAPNKHGTIIVHVQPK